MFFMSGMERAGKSGIRHTHYARTVGKKYI